MKKTKIIFVIGGLFSSIGKGIVASSLAKLLKLNKLKVSMQKHDPYLNIDCGLMNPGEHGEVFVTKDGLETDLDLGNYERFLNQKFSALSSITSGQIYQEVLNEEREGVYKGKTINIYDVSEKIQSKIFKIIEKEQPDCLVVELGGTIGDNDSKPFLIAAAQIQRILGSQNVVFVFLTYVNYFLAIEEFKTKPAQNSIALLRANAIEPNFVILRSNYEIPNKIKEKVAKLCYLKRENIFALTNINIFKVPLILKKEGLFDKIAGFFGFSQQLNLDNLELFIQKVLNLEESSKVINLAIINKYLNFKQSYISLYYAIYSAAIKTNIKFKYQEINPEEINANNYEQVLSSFDAVVVPGGFGARGIEGKLLVIKYARENKIPFLGVCLGMQLATIEFARNVLGLKRANSEEFVESVEKQPLVVKYFYPRKKTMLMGESEIVLSLKSLVFQSYQKKIIWGRHRHRLVVDSKYEKQFADHGFVCSGKTNDQKKTIEIMELKDHPFFVGTQFHIEWNSSPEIPNPLLVTFFKIAFSKQK